MALTIEEDAPFNFGEVGKFEFSDLLDRAYPHPLQQVVMPIVRRRGDQADVYGTAFSIGANLAMTATHVVGPDEPIDELCLVHVPTYDSDPTPVLLPVTEVTTNGSATDIAVLTFELPVRPPGRQIVLRRLRLGFGLAPKGSSCVILGYTHRPKMRSREEVLAMRPQLNASEGTVVDHYGERAANCAFPCYQIDGRADHQMSGGPILGEAADGMMAVRGVVSTGYQLMPGEDPLCFGSMLFPAAALRPNLYRGGATRIPTFVKELIHEGGILAEESELLELDDGDPAHPRIHLLPA